LEELKTLSFSYPKVPLEQWLQMTTINGAIALKADHQFGTIKPGTAPGIVLIENVDLHNMCLTSESVARRIV
jgi:cytosine/adenosine deaminase-related metal-dependent hydrolase